MSKYNYLPMKYMNNEKIIKEDNALYIDLKEIAGVSMMEDNIIYFRCLKNATYKEIGKRYSLSIERIRRIQMDTLRRLNIAAESLYALAYGIAN